MRRLPKDALRYFLSTQYSYYGVKYIKYMFGQRIASLFTDPVHSADSIELISFALSGFSFLFFHIELIFKIIFFQVVPTVKIFSDIFKMSEVEKENFIDLIEKINKYGTDGFPKYVSDSANDGLFLLVKNLVSTGFLNERN